MSLYYVAEIFTTSADLVEDIKLDFKAMRDRMFEFLAGVGTTYVPNVLVSPTNSRVQENKDAEEHTEFVTRQLAAHIKSHLSKPSIRPRHGRSTRAKS